MRVSVDMFSKYEPMKHGRAPLEGVSKPLTRCFALICGLLLLLLCFGFSESQTSYPAMLSKSAAYPTNLVKHALTVATPLLEVFQVYPPVLTVDTDGELELSDGTTSESSLDLSGRSEQVCQQTLVVHSFAYSYGIPFVGM